jgi:hypothetical protein
MGLSPARKNRRSGAGDVSQRGLLLHPASVAARRERHGRVPLRQPPRLLRALRVGLRLPDARRRRSGAGGRRLPGRRAQSSRRLSRRAPVRCPRLGRNLAGRTRLGALRSDRRRSPLAHRTGNRRRLAGRRALADDRPPRQRLAAPAAQPLGSGQQHVESVGTRLQSATPARSALAPRLARPRLARHERLAGHPLWPRLVARHPVDAAATTRRGPGATRLAEVLRALKRRGILRAEWEGPLDFAHRVAREKPDLAALTNEAAGYYAELRYGRSASNGQLLRRLQQCVRRLPPRRRKHS